MNGGGGFTRRGFMTLCASAVSCLASSRLLADAGRRAVQHYPRALLVDGDGVPIRCRDLEQGRNYVFHYPYRATPCFLLNLGQAVDGETLRTEAGQPYRWQGGVGPERAVVAFSAICAHKMTHPAPEVSFISYRGDQATFEDHRQRQQQRRGVIYCCSEKSVYDPARGAAVLGGPAPQPLAAIMLEYDQDQDTLWAVGTRGGEMFGPFFDQFGFRLALEYGTEDIRQPTAPRTPVVPLEVFSATRIRC